jgi:DDE superfamily endonuclease
VVARAVVGIPTVLCLWISEIIVSVPGRCAVTVLELLTGTMLTGYGSISQAILAVPCRRHWTSYYWMVRKGKFDWKAMVHALCRIVTREFPSERRVVVGDDTLIPRVSEAAPGASIQYDHARKPNRPDYILAQTVVSLSAVIGNSSGAWSVPLMSNLAVRTGNHGKLETMRAMLEEVSATLGAITLLLDAWYMKGYLISDVLTRDIIVIGQVRRDTALYDLPPLRTGKPGRPRKYGDRITKEKLNALPQTRTELPIYGSHRTVRYRTAVCRARFLGGRLVRVVWVSMFVDGKWTAERLLLSTDWNHTAEDVIFTYSLRWTIEPMFAALKWSEGMIDMWMQSVETFHRWLNMVQIGRALIQMLAVKADAATTALAQVAAWRKEPYLTAGMVKAGLVRAFWNIAPAEAWYRRGRKFDPSRCVPMRTRVVRTVSAA